MGQNKSFWDMFASGDALHFKTGEVDIISYQDVFWD